jgi:hypothetical protein
MLDVNYYGFVAIIKDARMKVIVKRVGDGTPFFWSLIPFWKNDKRNNGNKKILHAGIWKMTSLYYGSLFTV